MAVKARKPQSFKIGERFFIEGVECRVKFINNGMAWVVPTVTDTRDGEFIIEGLAFARVESDGKVVLL